jgi:hypothetical protein
MERPSHNITTNGPLLGYQSWVLRAGVETNKLPSHSAHSSMSGKNMKT